MNNDIGTVIEYTGNNADRALLIAYLQMKVRHEDWHAVSDAANDLREMDAISAALKGEE